MKIKNLQWGNALKEAVETVEYTPFTDWAVGRDLRSMVKDANDPFLLSDLITALAEQGDTTFTAVEWMKAVAPYRKVYEAVQKEADDECDAAMQQYRTPHEKNAHWREYSLKRLEKTNPAESKFLSALKNLLDIVEEGE